MAGLVPAMICSRTAKLWMPGASPGMTARLWSLIGIGGRWRRRRSGTLVLRAFGGDDEIVRVLRLPFLGLGLGRTDALDHVFGDDLRQGDLLAGIRRRREARNKYEMDGHGPSVLLLDAISTF